MYNCRPDSEVRILIRFHNLETPKAHFRQLGDNSSLSLSLSLLLSLRVRSWLEMETEALGSEGGEQGDWTQSHVKGQRAASPQGAGSTTQRAGDGGSVGAGGATEEERPRWEPKLTAQTLLIHWGFGCLWPPGVYTHLSERSCQLNTVEPPQPQRAAHWAQKQQKKKKKKKKKQSTHKAAVTSGPHLTDMKLFSSVISALTKYQ